MSERTELSRKLSLELVYTAFHYFGKSAEQGLTREESIIFIEALVASAVSSAKVAYIENTLPDVLNAMLDKLARFENE